MSAPRNPEPQTPFCSANVYRNVDICRTEPVGWVGRGRGCARSCARSCVRGCGPRRGGEGGFALASVLGLIALTSLVVVALLGLLLTTIRVTAAHEAAARELRAADGAVEAAIAQLRRNPATGDPCGVAAPGQPVDSLSFDQGTAVPGDDVTVEVDCDVDVVGDDTAAASDQVRLVGADGYQGDVRWSTDCGAGAAGPGCFPWSAAFGSVPGGLTGSGPTLVHSGADALVFNSGVTVRRGAAAVRNPVDGSPALRVAGQYLQGRPGPGATGDDCGLLAGSAGAGPALVADLDDQPSCADPGAAALDAWAGGATTGPAVPAVSPAVPACAGSVVTFSPGRYDAARTAAVTSLVDGSTCTGRTFHFLPGLYSFDANDPSRGADRHAIVFGDATSRYIFGELATTGDAAAAQCDDAVSGASIVISARTELQHRGGRLSVCPAFDGTGAPFPAIHQESAAPNQPVLVEATSGPGHFQDVANLMDDRYAGTSARAVFSCTTFEASCNAGAKTFTTRWSSPGSAPLRSAVVSITGNELYPANLIEGRRVGFRVRNAAGAVVCDATLDGLPNSYLTTSYDLLAPGSGCAGALTNEAQLDGARIEVTPRYRFSNPFVQQTFYVSAVQLRTNLWVGPVGAAATRGAEWLQPGNVVADDSASSTPSMPCPATVCQLSGPKRAFEHQLTTTGITIDVPAAAEPVAGAARITSLVARAKVVVPRYEVNGYFFLPEGSTRIDVRTSSGSCSVPFPGYVNSSQQIEFDLLAPGGTCATLLTDVAQLDGAALDLTISTDCVVDLVDATKCWQVKPPSVQHLDVALTTDVYSGPPPTSRATIDATTSGPGSTFNVLGRAWMPLSDLDVHWRGAVTDQPLFRTELVLHGLGSDMAPDAQTGVVCCSPRRPDFRTLDVTARIDGVDRLVVKVRIVDRDPASGAWTPGVAVRVLDYRECDATSCDPPAPG